MKKVALNVPRSPPRGKTSTHSDMRSSLHGFRLGLPSGTIETSLYHDDRGWRLRREWRAIPALVVYARQESPSIVDGRLGAGEAQRPYFSSTAAPGICRSFQSPIAGVFVAKSEPF